MDFAFFSNSVINFTDRGASLNPGAITFNINAYGSKPGKVYNNEGCFNFGNIRKTLIIMASASNSKMDSKLFGANNSGLDMGFV